MSYILEALKKAEAERQLGSAPSVHVPQVAGTSSRDTRRGRMALWAALAVLGAGAAVFAYLKWPATQRPVPRPAVAAAAPAPTAPVPAAPPSAAVFTAAPAPAQVAAPPAAAAPKPEPEPEPEPGPEPAPIRAAPPPVAAAPAPEESYPFLRDLPEAITRELPQVAIGGYIYSKNPADRLLLVDKVLRREGEEVAPGLTLEKLLPKAALLNYRGYRYRVAY